MKKDYIKHNKCIICQKIITNRAKRCKKHFYHHLSRLAKIRLKNPKNNPNYKDGRSIKIYYCKKCAKKITWQSGFYKKQLCLSCEVKRRKLWQNPLYRYKTVKAILKGLQIKPNKPEKLLSKLLPKTFRYVGNGKIIIDRFNPDFIDIKNKKIVEMFGDYWHNLKRYKKTDRRRLLTYKKYNYKVLIIWEKELKNTNKLKKRILNFIKNE